MPGTEVARPMPETFMELDQAAPPDRCLHCNERPATHTLSVGISRIGNGKGAAVKQIRSKKVCERCAVKIYMTVARAVRAL